MKRTLSATAIILGATSLGVVVEAQSRKRSPTLYEACMHKVEGDACTANTKRGTFTGTCVPSRSDEEQLVCMPAKVKHPPRSSKPFFPSP